MDEAHTGLGLIFLLVAFIVCGGIVIWLIISEGIRHTRQAESPLLKPRFGFKPLWDFKFRAANFI